MPSSVRSRLGLASLALLVIGLVCQGVGVHFGYTSGSFAKLTVLTSLGSYFVVVAAMAALGVVASLVIEEGLKRKLWMDAGYDEHEDEDEPDQETS